jgi:hypothetical protein
LMVGLIRNFVKFTEELLAGETEKGRNN